jgi:anti-anti-sigma factor
LENRTEPADWHPDAFGMVLDVDRGRLVLRLSGEADASVATAIEQVLRDAVMHPHEGRDVEVVLADVTYLDGRVMGVLLGVGDELRSQGRAFGLVAPSPSAVRLLEILGLDRILDVRGSDSELPMGSL